MSKFEFDLKATEADIAEMNKICGYYNIDFNEFLNILIYRTLNCGELPFYPTYDSPNVDEIVESLNDTDSYKTFDNIGDLMSYIANSEKE